MTSEKSLLLIEIARWIPDPQKNLSNNVTLRSRYAFFGIAVFAQVAFPLLQCEYSQGTH